MTLPIELSTVNLRNKNLSRNQLKMVPVFFIIFLTTLDHNFQHKNSKNHNKTVFSNKTHMETIEKINYSCEEEKTFSMLCHLAALSGIIIPFGHIIGPLVIWLIKKDQYPEVDRQGKAALNFQISVTIYMAIAGILVLLLIGFLLLAVLGVFAVVLTIIAAVKSSNAERFEYPFTISIIN